MMAAPFAAGLPPQAGGARARRVIAGVHRAFLMERDGSVKVWGYGSTPTRLDGRHAGLGSDAPIPTHTAIEIPGLRDVADMAAGTGAYAVLANGHVVSWGINARGELGNTPRGEVEVLARASGSRNTPTPVLDVTEAVQVASIGDHALALTRRGTVWAWGHNNEGQLGIGDMPVIDFRTRSPSAMNFLPFPMTIPGLTDVTAIAAGASHSLALLKDGTVRAWGMNRWGQLGDGTTVRRLAPIAVAGVRNAVAIGAGTWNSAALLADGTMMTWGFGTGFLGRPGFRPDAAHPVPALVPGVSGIRAFSAGLHFVLAVTQKDTVVSWGTEIYGEIGHRGGMPAPVAGLSGVRSVAAREVSFAVLADDTIMTWGPVPVWARVDHVYRDIAHTPIPLVLKGLQNPMTPMKEFVMRGR